MRTRLVSLNAPNNSARRAAVWAAVWAAVCSIDRFGLRNVYFSAHSSTVEHLLNY